ncbi:hypothetical protein Q31b_07000 [Novipirellula aureliae]|uniref:Type II secretion system protein G n=1 Tax=Novipirellula aureliae TaxID=2527966 RepID=A0A5C6ED91_9BACT|nr:type II secretion system protein [Novipirellula aureliae]TWU45526.1 hypothetical protein Q31b_07000 [Novipirellula aureliae]
MIWPPIARRNRRSVTGFTLVEILVVLIIIGVMSAMVMTAVTGVTNSARTSRTRTIIATIDSVIQEQYESFKYRPLPVEIVDMSQGITDADMQLSREVLAVEAARVRLLMLRDLQRMEMPDRYSDIYNGPIQPRAAANLVKIAEVDIPPNIKEGDIIGTRTAKDSRYPVVVSSIDSAKRTAYLSRLPATLPTAEPEKTLFYTNQSAECLYLIMATSFVGGTPAIDMIPSSNTGDTDGDGIPEILDGWGQPIGFVRWPVGYYDPTGSLDVTVPDEFDLFRSDFAYSDIPTESETPSSDAVVRAVSVNTAQNSVFPWSLRPLIISAGEDSQFGIAFNPYRTIDDPSDPEDPGLDTFSYVNSAWKWRVDAKNMGTTEYLGRGDGSFNYIVPDPYMRSFIRLNDPDIILRSATNRRLIGEPLSADRDPVLADNITNFALQESR